MTTGRDERVADLYFVDQTSHGSPAEEGLARRVNDDIEAFLGGTIKSLTGGLTEAQHKALYNLIHFIGDGPGEGFASGAFREVIGGVFPTSITWWVSGSKLLKIFEQTIDRSTGIVFPTTVSWKMYDVVGTLQVTLTDTITYSGGCESTRTRVLVVPGDIVLSGTSAGVGTPTGALSLDVSMAGTSAGVATPTGNLTVFQPTDIASLTGTWTVDMDPASGTLTSWNDGSGNSYDLDGVLGNPQVDVSLDGNNAPSFDGTGDYVDGTGSATLANVLGTGADGDFEIWCVCDLSASGAGGSYFNAAPLFTGADGWMGLAVDSSSNVRFGYNDGSSGDIEAVDAVNITDSAPHVVRGRLDGTTLYLRVDDRTEVSAGTVSAFRTHTDLIRIATNYNGAVRITGELHLWVFNQPLSTSDRDDMYAWISANYPSVTVP